MKFTKLISISSLSTMALATAAGVMTVASTSCGGLPERPKYVGPQSSESDIPWNRRLPGEGQGQFGGLGSQ